MNFITVFLLHANLFPGVFLGRVERKVNCLGNRFLTVDKQDPTNKHDEGDEMKAVTIVGG